MIPECLKSGIILPLFKGKLQKKNIVPYTLYVIYEMILLNRLDNFAVHKGVSSEMQFGFREDVGCVKPSFTILDTMDNMLERGSKVFSCFLDVHKAFDKVRMDGILYKLFSELGTGGRMWKVMKDLYTNANAQVSYAGSLSKKVIVSQGKAEFLRHLCTTGYSVCAN